MAGSVYQFDTKPDTMERVRRSFQQLKVSLEGAAFVMSAHVDGVTIIAPGEIAQVKPGSIQALQLGILTTRGDLMTHTGSTHQRLGIGSVGEFLKVGTDGLPIWGAGGGGSGTATYAITAGTATYAISSGTSTESLHATAANFATTAGTATEALHAGTATYSQYLSPGFYFSVPTGMAVAGNPNNGAGTTTLSLTTQTLSIPGGLSVTGNLTANNYSGTSSGTNTGDQVNATIGTSPPASTSVLWLDSNSGKLFSWYVAQWIEVGAWDGLISFPYAAKSSTYPATASDWLINCTSGTFTVTLPTAVGATGKAYKVKNSGTGLITLATTGGQMIDGQTTQPIHPGDCIEVISTGANWIIT